MISPRPGIRFQRLDGPDPILRWPLPDEPARTSDSRPDPIGLCCSPRALPKDRPELGYGPGYLARRVIPAGIISYQRHQLFISSAFAGWHVGLRPQGENALEVWLIHLLVGELNLQTMRFGSAPSRSAKAHGLAA